jgi:gag-polypeptide of LTR copia-type
LGTAHQPIKLEEHGGVYYKLHSLVPLTDNELKAHEKEEEAYEQKQAAVQEVIYQTVDKSTFLQVKNETTAAAVWKKVTLIHADKGLMSETNLLMQLQTIQYVENGDMWEHLMKMTEIKEQLTKMNFPVTDESFVSYIHTSLLLIPNCWTLLTTLSATAHESGKKLTSSNLIWHLTEKANSLTLKDSINKSNAAMLAVTTKSLKGKGKNRLKSKRDEIKCTNTSCGEMGHMKDQCYAKGGGKEKEAPGSRRWLKGMQHQWVQTSWRKLKMMIHAMLTYSIPDDPTALIVTSDFKAEAEALAISNLSRIILDSGASRHFSPDHLKLLNFKEISSEPITPCCRNNVIHPCMSTGSVL